MNRKLLVATSAMLLTFGILLPIPSIVSAGIPNPNHIYWVTDDAPVSVDPHWAYDTASCEVIQNIYEGLMAFDGASTEAFVARLADWWPGYGVGGNVIVPQGPNVTFAYPVGTVEQYIFHVRTGVKWHDWNTSGLYLQASDVEYSIERGMLQDHTGGPMWMLYEPLLGVSSAYGFDYNHNDVIDEGAEYDDLFAAVLAAVESNDTTGFVWFNLPAHYAAFQQVLCHSCAMVIQEEWAIANGCWGATKDYADFIVHFDPPPPGPLDDPPVMCGAGPYVVEEADWDPHTGSITYHKNFDYWRGWAGNHAEYATFKIVEPWAVRKAMFFSTYPDFQADLCKVPRENIAEMHVGGDKNGPTYAGFDMVFVPAQTMSGLLFSYDINTTSPYIPRIGITDVPDLFEDRFVRLAFIYALNVTQYSEEYWLDEMIQPTTCMPPGIAFYNETFPTRNIDTSKVEYYLANAMGGAIYNNGMTVAITYDIGNSATETIAKMIEDVIENQITWTGGQIDIQPTGLQLWDFIQCMYTGKLPAFTLSHYYLFPDPHGWLGIWMDSNEDSLFAQNITYGLEDITEDWLASFTYGPPPYTNALGEYVNAINNTYVDHLISTALGQVPATREAIYNELMCIYYAEAASYPVCTPINRHYERTWVNGWIGGWNNNPICPGMYFYDMWKGTAETIYSVDISAMDGTNTTEVYPKILVFHGDMYTGGGVEEYAEIYYNITVTRLDAGPDPASVVVYVGFLRNETDQNIMYIPLDYVIILGPGDTHTITMAKWWEGGTMTEGNWTICLWVSPTGTAGAQVDESSLANNLYESPYQVEARELEGDILPDGVVDIFDAILLANAFGYSEGQEGYNPDADLNSDGTIDIFDAVILAKNFGNTWP